MVNLAVSQQPPELHLSQSTTVTIASIAGASGATAKGTVHNRGRDIGHQYATALQPLYPHPSSLFSCTLKSWEWPGYKSNHSYCIHVDSPVVMVDLLQLSDVLNSTQWIWFSSCWILLSGRSLLISKLNISVIEPPMTMSEWSISPV